MCGICGWIEFSQQAELAVAERMNASLAHRGPDDAGVVLLDNAAIANSRLSIIDLASGHQPIANQNESCWIVFNGEIYNFHDLREQLTTKGYRFSTRSDTEVILHAYEEWGIDCVSRLRGMFAFAIYDRRQEASGNGDRGASTRLILARDRVGKKPLYYYYDRKRFIFGSEIKAILAHPSVPRRVRHNAIPLYLTYGYVPAPDTMFDDIYELPPGHSLMVQDKQVVMRQYWQVPAPGTRTTHVGLCEQEYIDRLRQLFEHAVRVRLISDVPLGAFLSGGLDSSLVVAIMSRLMNQPVKTFAIGFSDEPSFNELKYARTVADRYGTDHHEFTVSPDAIDLLPKLVWHYDQPFADSSAIPSFLLAQMTRKHVKVVLTGDGGDELFAGYERFAAARLAEAYRRVPRFVETAAAQLIAALPESTSYSGFARRARRFMQGAPLPLSERYLEWVGIFGKNAIRELFAGPVGVDPVDHFRRYFDPGQNDDATGQLLSVNMKSYLPGDLLVKTDRTTMANSLEARCPFLDQELLEFASTIPTGLKLKGMTTKYILKRAFEGFIPDRIVHRKKHGFGVPVGRWFRTSLRDYVRDTILSPDALGRGYFREEALRRLLEEHQSGKRDHGHRLWSLLTFEMWHRVFIDQEGAPCRLSPIEKRSVSFALLGG